MNPFLQIDIPKKFQVVKLLTSSLPIFDICKPYVMRNEKGEYKSVCFSYEIQGLVGFYKHIYTFEYYDTVGFNQYIYL